MNYTDTHCQFAAGRTATLRLILFLVILLILLPPALVIGAVARLRLHSRRLGDD